MTIIPHQLPLYKVRAASRRRDHRRQPRKDVMRNKSINPHYPKRKSHAASPVMTPTNHLTSPVIGRPGAACQGVGPGRMYKEKR